MSRVLQRSTVIIATLLGAASSIRAQVASSPPATMDSAFARARALVASGNGAAGRLLVDSVLAATDPASPSYADALYWHAMLASSESDAERDYRRIVVEYALAPRAADALLQLAQLESGHGDRSSATSHLARFFNENPSHPERGRAGALLTRLLFEQNDLPRACSALRQTLAVIPDSVVEARNQLTYYAPRCTALDASPGSRVPVSAGGGGGGRGGRGSPDSAAARRDTVVARAAPARYTLQVATYGTKAEADRVAARLRARDIDARVVGVKKPFRVRIGRYTTRGNAAAAQRELRSKKVTTFVTDIEPEDK
jgi:tetratricopeptide (TPR) repeat protein